MDVHSRRAVPAALSGGHRRPLRSATAALLVMLLGVLASLVAAPAANAAPVAPAARSARHGRPGAPTLVVVTGNADDLVIGYDAPASDGGHKIRRYQATLNGGRTWKKIGREADEFGVLIGNRKHLKVGKRYEVAVRAVNKKGHGRPSQTQTIIAVNPPGKPRDVSVSVADGRVTVSWKAPKHDGGRPVVSYDAVATTADEVVLGTVCDQPQSGADRSCTISGLVSGASYNATVAASNYVKQPADADPKIVGRGDGDFATNVLFVAP